MSSSQEPTRDQAENNAFFPSPYSLGAYVPPMSDYDRTEHEKATGTRRKVLLIGADERYLKVQNGRLFSTGNHPVETLVPVLHLEAVFGACGGRPERRVGAGLYIACHRPGLTHP